MIYHTKVYHTIIDQIIVLAVKAPFGVASSARLCIPCDASERITGFDGCLGVWRVSVGSPTIHM